MTTENGQSEGWNSMIRDLGRYREIVDKLKLEIEKAYFEGWMDSDKEHPDESFEGGWHNWDWKRSRANRVAGGLE